MSIKIFTDTLCTCAKVINYEIHTKKTGYTVIYMYMYMYYNNYYTVNVVVIITTTNLKYLLLYRYCSVLEHQLHQAASHQEWWARPH